MTQTDLLDNTEVDLPPVADPAKNYLTDLVGENQKFKTNEDLARGKFEADQYIEILKRQRDLERKEFLKMREENVTKAKIEELIDQATKRLASSEHTEANEDKQKPVIDLNEIEAMFEKKLSAKKLEEKETENFNKVKTKLTERFGDNYANVVKKQIETIGLSSEDFNSLAKKSPEAVFKTLGLDARQDDLLSPIHSSRRNDNFSPAGAKKRSWSYYQELYKKDPKMIYDRNLSVQMQKDAVSLGEAFRDGDYYVKGLHEE